MADTKRGRERKGADKAWQRARRHIEAELDARDQAPPWADDEDAAVDAEDGRSAGRDEPRLVDVVEQDLRTLAAPDIGRSSDGDD